MNPAGLQISVFGSLSLPGLPGLMLRYSRRWEMWLAVPDSFEGCWEGERFDPFHVKMSWANG